jgi:hypothetical protein
MVGAVGLNLTEVDAGGVKCSETLGISIGIDDGIDWE